LIYGLLITENIIINNKYNKMNSSIIVYIYNNLIKSYNTLKYFEYIFNYYYPFNIEIDKGDINNKKYWE